MNKIDIRLNYICFLDDDMVDYLLLIDGINSADFYYVGVNKKNVKIGISYDSKIINKNKIYVIEENFN